MSSPSPQRSPSTLTLRFTSTTLPLLRFIRNSSGATFTIFTILHLASPLSALLPSRPKYLSSPENRASGVQLLAREVYQGRWSEPILVFGSLATHIVSGIAVRWIGVIERIERRRIRKEEVKRLARQAATSEASVFSTGPGLKRVSEVERDLVVDEVMETEAELVATTTDDEELLVPAIHAPASSSILQPPNLHQATGYLLIFPLIHHLYTHRILPSSPFPPISALSPSFFNYSYTALALNHESRFLRAMTALSYAAITLLTTYHGLVGWRILLDPTAPRSLKPRRKRAGEKGSLRKKVTRGREWQVGWIALVAGVGIGTVRIAGHLGGERVKLPQFVASRMEYVLKKGFWAA
ncbi:hypothetical protein JCM11641_000307 [Rhodosporidiobolus odoratus]